MDTQEGVLRRKAGWPGPCPEAGLWVPSGEGLLVPTAPTHTHRPARTPRALEEFVHCSGLSLLRSASSRAWGGSFWNSKEEQPRLGCQA